MLFSVLGNLTMYCHAVRGMLGTKHAWQYLKNIWHAGSRYFSKIWFELNGLSLPQVNLAVEKNPSDTESWTVISR